ncbi:MAG: MarR family EPS-associated transcriptional regulator [Gammaproteobacteria bacterium]|nr:MarR family EPS-associated transcriptional regulator [Gammaproteobacteria bacterium]
MPADEVHYRIIKLIEVRPDISQRQLAEALGISLGKVNYCLKALIDKRQVKAHNFQYNPNKKTYAYLLTREGIEEKARLTSHFLKFKMAEYERLKQEIEQLRREAGQELAGTETLLADYAAKD